MLSVNIICKLSSTAVGTVQPYTGRNLEGCQAARVSCKGSHSTAEQNQWSKRELLGLSRAAWGLFRQNHSSFNLWVPEGCDSYATQYRTQDFTDVSGSHKSGVTVRREHIRAHGYEARHYKETVKNAEVERHLITYCRN